MIDDFYIDFFKKVNKNILSKNDNKPIALYTGLAGQLLYYSTYSKHFTDETGRQEFRALVETFFDSLNTQNYDSSFCSGLSGVAFLLRHLDRQQMLEGYDYAEFLEQVDQHLLEITQKEVNDLDEVDFLHGFLGIANYLMEFRQLSTVSDQPVPFGNITKAISEHLDRIDLSDKNTELINFGLSHGLASYIQYFIKLYKHTNALECKIYIGKIVAIYRYFFNEAEQSCFPSQGYTRQDSNYNVNLGWCYGDQTISYSLYKAGELLNDEQLKEFSILVLNHWIMKNSADSAFISPLYDSMFCHGLAGVAHMCKKWYIITGNEALHQNYHYFINKIKESKMLFSKFDNLKDGYAENFWLLDGSCGLGLVLLDSLQEIEKENDWDYFFLLN